MSLTVTTRLLTALAEGRLPRLECAKESSAHMLRRLPACWPDNLLATSSRYRLYAKSTAATAVTKPTTTKKKYSELPALHPLSDAVFNSQTTSNCHHAHYPHVPECASFAPERLLLSVNMNGCFSIFHSWDFERVFDFISAVITA